MEERKTQLIETLQEAEKFLEKIGIKSNQKSELDKKLSELKVILGEIKKISDDIKVNYKNETKEIKELIEKLKKLKLEEIRDGLEFYAKQIKDNLPEWIKPTIKTIEENNRYKISFKYLEKEGYIDLYNNETLLANIVFINSPQDNKELVIKDIFKMYKIISYINTVIGYED
ncbi:hypothetical protein [Clostridium sp.]|uniref:hypothetical protein n=1 Tax=Clostridium sp. TaxID=1506 RepID=UPI0026264730|nr:hypothetical protein [Clostridium sp.]